LVLQRNVPGKEVVPILHLSERSTVWRSSC
jgi:hypothetical protein